MHATNVIFSHLCVRVCALAELVAGWLTPRPLPLHTRLPGRSTHRRDARSLARSLARSPSQSAAESILGQLNVWLTGRYDCRQKMEELPGRPAAGRWKILTKYGQSDSYIV